ncbi:hypothetical protein MM213_10790 [Belliella sp. R4-6]|uniref:Uncharacterized protein n=1 Tax=Belliella alkalica TaxID=1730871 RepID=A0ABS9VC13_9BACT|nr:hypothetical protein [Belliella alkalica]MCH7413975.1 hypothetical protein [Belliella alkalica]
MKYYIFKISACIFLLSIINLGDAFAQKFILLQKGTNQKSRLKYEVGETFTYKSKKNDYYITDVIKDIQTDIIVLSENILRPEDITSVEILHKDHRNSTIKNLSTLSYGAGLILVTAESINSLYHDGSFGISSGGLITAGALFGTGFTLSKVRYRHFKNTKRNKIQLVILYGD